MNMNDYNDITEEEEILGFPIWVAELELIVGSARGKKKPDPVQCFQLLQKLLVTLDRTASSDIRPHQRRCEDALVDILLKGAPPPVRRLVCEALSKLYSRGDQLPLYSRASALQLFLGTKEASGRETAEDVRLGALECISTLYYNQGQQLSIGVHETAQLATKYALKSHAKGTRRTALRLMAAAVEGVGSYHRMALQVQEIVLKAVEKILSKEGKNATEPVKIGCADVLRALGASGGACFWVNNLSNFEYIRSVCLEFLEDSTSEAVRNAFATALGQIAAASSSDAAIATFKSPPDNNNNNNNSNSNNNSKTDAGHRKKAASQEKALAEVPIQCLTTPFMESVAASNRQACTSLAKAWVVYLSTLRYRQNTMTAGPSSSLSSSVPPESQDDTSLFLDEVMKPLEAVSAASMSTGGAPEKPIGQNDAELGAGISSGERPHGQACALYIMRVGGIEALGEQAQRALLSRLAAFLSTPAGLPVPAAIVGLESIALLLEVLGEAGEEARTALEPQIAAKLVGPSQALRLQAASTLGALAMAEAASAARLLAACLANLRSSLSKLEKATAVKGRGDRSRPLVPGTPRGIGSAKIKDELNNVHGWALGISALLSVTVALPLGVPSRLISAALDVAVDLANGSLNAEAMEQQQGGSAGVSGLLAAQAVKREAGHIMLGALCLSMPREQLAGPRRAYFLELWKPALGTDSAALLDAACRATLSGAEHALAQEVWWRLSALDSLMAYVHVVIPASHSLDKRNQLAKNVAELLAPILTVLSNQPILQHPTKARGGPAGPLAASISYLHLKLLQIFLSLPPTMYSEEQQVQLMQVSMRAVVSANGAGGHPPLGLLRRWLDIRDAQLGPWGDGAHGGGQDPLEAALLCFEGSAGGPPTYLPWEAGLRMGGGYRLPSEDDQFREGNTSSDDDHDPDDKVDRDDGGSDEEDEVEQRNDNRNSTSNGVAFERRQHSSSLLPTPTTTSSSSPRPFSQNESLGTALLRTHVAMIGALFKCVDKAGILKMLDALLQPLTLADVAVQQRKKDKPRRQALVIAAVAAALAGSSGLGNNNNVMDRDNGEVSSRYVAMARMTLDEALAASPPSGHNNNPNYEISEHGFSPIVCILLRSSADLFAAAAALAPDTEALSLVKAVCREMADTGSLPQRAALALAVGGMSRALGGLSLQAIIQPAAETLLAVAAASDTSIAPWLLHSVLTCAYAAGLSFMPFVSRTLALDLRMLLSETVYSLSGLLPAIGRLANGMVAVLGPEYMPGSSAYISCKSIINDMKAPSASKSGGGGGEDALSAMLETVLYSQMLVLFAPRAAGETGIVAKQMVGTLLSRQPRLRKAASDTLRHLTERDPEGVATAGMEATLFEALDAESDPTIAAQIKATLKTLLTADGPKRPSKWIALCADVIAAHAPGGSQQQQQAAGSGYAAKAGGLGGERGSDSDEENGGNVNTTSPPASARSTASDAAGAPQQQISSGARRAAGLTPRLKTRLFAAACLLHLPKLVCSSDPRHTQVTASQLRGLASFDDDDGDWMVLKLQQLVDLGFKMVGGQLEALRPLGVTLLTILIDTFGTLVDPLAEDVMVPSSLTSAHISRPLLMQLYQAQLISALRASLSLDASPPLRAAGATLAVAFLENNLAGGDAVVLDRLMSLLAAPLFYHDEKNQLLLGSSEGSVSFRTKASSSSLSSLSNNAKQSQATGTSAGVDDSASPRGGTKNAVRSSSSSSTSSPVQPYADWVEAKSRAALLEAHAHCTLLAASAASSTDSEQVLKTKKIVNESQRRHRDQLVDWWFGLLQDYVLLCREPENVQVGYKPAVWNKNVPSLAPGSRSLAAAGGGRGTGGISKVTFPGGKEDAAVQKQQHKTAAPLAMAMATRPALEKAWPAVLEATAVTVACRLGISSDTEIQLRQAVLLDIIQAALCVAWETRSEVHLAVALSALQQLTTPAFLQRKWIAPSVVCDLSEMVLELVRDIIVVDNTHSTDHHHHYRVSGKVAMATASISRQLATYSTSFSTATLLTEYLTHQPAAALINMSMHEKNAALTILLEAMSLHVCHCLSLKVNIHDSSSSDGGDDGYEGGESKMTSSMLLALDVLTHITYVDDTQQLQQQDLAHAVVDFISNVANEVENDSTVLPSTVMSLAGIAEQAVAANNAVVVGAALSSMLECTHAVVVIGGGGNAANGAAIVKLTLENVGFTALDSKDTQVQASAMKALRVHLQKLQEKKVLTPEWALRCVTVLGAPAAATVHKLNQEKPGTLLEAGSVVQYENEMILETFKILLLCVALTVVGPGEGRGGRKSIENAPQSLLQLLVPLLIEAAGNISRPEVSNTSVNMLTELASSAAGELFKAQVAALPIGVKQRLRAAIQVKASTDGGVGGGVPAAAAAGQQAAAIKPGIQLKSFAQLKRKI